MNTVTEFVESYSTTSSDIKQSIIAASDAKTARNLCQVDKQHRMICRDRLPNSEKYRLCLNNSTVAKECDSIPMFSRQQFLRLIPEKILIYPEDPIQVTHEFYSQSYKLPDEGFTVALRKAKIMNTICAIMRPDFLLTPEAKELHVPAYIDVNLLDIGVKEYLSAKNSDHRRLKITVVLRTNRPITLIYNDYLAISVVYAINKEAVPKINEVVVADVFIKHMRDLDKDMFMDQASKDEYLADVINRANPEAFHKPYSAYLSFLIPGTAYFNMFHLSRIVKIVMDIGYFYAASVYFETENTESDSYGF